MFQKMSLIPRLKQLADLRTIKWAYKIIPLYMTIIFLLTIYFKAPLDGDLAPDGNVVLSGKGSWNLGEMCVEWDDKVEKYFSIF